MGDGRCGSLLLWIANCEAFETRRLQLVADAAAEVGTIGWLVGWGELKLFFSALSHATFWQLFLVQGMQPCRKV